MIKKIALYVILVTFFSHTAEQINYTVSTPGVESNIDLFEDIINEWNPSTPACTDNGHSRVPFDVKTGQCILKPVESVKTSKIPLTKDAETKKMVLDGFVFDTSLCQNDNRKILAKLIKNRRANKKYHCCLSNSKVVMDWKQFTTHVRKNHAIGKKVQCPQCTIICSTYQLGYEHIATHEHQDLFSCPKGCPKPGVARDSQHALELHFLSCLYKDNVALPVQNGTVIVDAQYGANPVNKNVTNQPDHAPIASKNNQIARSENDELIFSTFCKSGKENTHAPHRYQITEYVDEISTVVKAVHQQRKDDLIQCFKTWFGILNYIKETKVGAKSACPLCRKTYAHSNRAASCYIEHWDSKAFECKKCNTVLKHFDEYKQHRQRCVSALPFVCPKTRPVSTSDNAQVEHHKKHIDTVLKKITCCGMLLNNWAVALNHVSNRHKQLNSQYTCPHCKATYNTNIRSLECFLKNKNKTIFTCSLCNVDCQAREDLLKHVESECIELKEATESGNNHTPYSVVQNNVIVSNVQPHVINIPSNSYQSTNSNRANLSTQSADVGDEFHYYPYEVEQTMYNPIYSNVPYDYGHADNSDSQPTHDNNECITNQVTNEIVDNSIYEYHRYFQNL